MEGGGVCDLTVDALVGLEVAQAALAQCPRDCGVPPRSEMSTAHSVYWVRLDRKIRLKFYVFFCIFSTCKLVSLIFVSNQWH